MRIWDLDGSIIIIALDTSDNVSIIHNNYMYLSAGETINTGQKHGSMQIQYTNSVFK